MYFCTKIRECRTVNQNIKVNYEEMIANRDSRQTNKVRLPYGYFYKRLIDEKYSNFVEFDDEVAENILFNDCIHKQCGVLGQIRSKRQLHFVANEDGTDEGIFALAVEPGNFQNFEQLLNDAPAVVAQKDFVDTTIHDLVECVSELHQLGVQYLCFAPSNIFVRKNDKTVRLLLHGSCFLPLKMADILYEGIADYIAPEVMTQGQADDRSDVYSLAKFIEYLYDSSGMPFELKTVMKKATAENPDDRYASVKDMYDAMKNRTTLRRTTITAVAAIVIALAVVGLYFDLLPSPEPVEYVKPVEEPIGESLLDEGFDPIIELGPDADSATIARAIQDYMMKDSDKIDAKKLREFEAKGEQIFRKQFAKAADQILSKIYNNDRMNNDEKKFKASSDQVMKELLEKQAELTKSSSLSNEKAQRIASEIIEQLSEKKKADMEKKSKE